MFRRSASQKRPYARCSFCGKGQDRVEKLIAGPGVFICDQCIGLCVEVLESDARVRNLTVAASSEAMDVLLDELRINAAGLKQSEEQLQRAISLLRRNQVPWSRIGEAIGTSRQAAWERFSGED